MRPGGRGGVPGRRTAEEESLPSRAENGAQGEKDHG